MTDREITEYAEGLIKAATAAHLNGCPETAEELRAMAIACTLRHAVRRCCDCKDNLRGVQIWPRARTEVMTFGCW